MADFKFSSVIFDMDGLMFDTELLSRQHWQRAAADFGFTVSNELYLYIIGRVLPDTEQLFKDNFGAEVPFDAIYAKKLAYYDQHVAQYGVPMKPGLLALLDFLAARQIRMAVASSTFRPTVTNVLARAEIQDRFQVVISGDQVQNGKPAPDIFLRAAQELHTSPHECLVFEDSEPGIRAAHAAGMISVMIPDLKPPSSEIKTLADMIFASLAEALEFLQQQI